MLNLTLLVVAKILALFAIGLYIIFALVIIKQVGLMVKTVEVGMEGVIRLVAWAHLIFALVVFFIALTTL